MSRRRLAVTAALVAVVGLFSALLVVPTLFGASQFLFGGSGAGSGDCTDTSSAGVQPAAATEARAIPSTYLDLYKKAGQEYGLPWNLLAGIGKVETDHGQSRSPGVSSGENYAGAGGPMQFLKPTFDEFAVDGNKDGKKDRYDPADAIPTAAKYLKHNGAPTRTRTAVFMYNHSWDYVNLVLSWAKKYANGNYTPIQSDGVDCKDDDLPPEATALVQRILAFALAQRGKRYIFGATGPDAWDCSSLIQAAYRSVGLSIPRTTFEQWPFGVKVKKGEEQPGDLVFFNSGPGTSSNNPGHVGMVLRKGMMVVASCSTCSPNIGVKTYRRPDWVGTTRPLARKDFQQKITQLAAQGG